MSSSNGGVTVRQIAQHAKVSPATVSYALRGHPKIPEATRERVLAVARELGYRPNPRVAALMAHISRGKAASQGERIAFVWVHTPRSACASDPFLRAVFEGARRRAEQMGFALEEFWTADDGMNDRRLQKIILSRGIVGVALSPVTTNEAAVTLDWDWSQFAAAVIGNVSWSPELHHAGHHHFLGMRNALQELAGHGAQRPAALIEPESNTRAKLAWEAAFLVHHPDPSRARDLLRVNGPQERADWIPWLQRAKPDALIVSSNTLLESSDLREWSERENIPIATLHWAPQQPNLAGIDQCYDRIAAHAIDLVVSQLNSNEIGPPDLPSIMLFPGRWREPAAVAEPA